MAFNRKPFRLGRAASPLLSSPKQRISQFDEVVNMKNGKK